VYDRYVVSKKVRRKSDYELMAQNKNNTENVRFKLRKEEEEDSYESTKLYEEVEQPNLVVRRSERVRKPFKMYGPPNFCSTFLLTYTYEDPKSVREGINSVEGRLWKDAMVEEMESLHKNEMWDLVQCLSRRNPFSSKWVFKKKMNATGQVNKFKA
jgi:hypothetical protein